MVDPEIRPKSVRGNSSRRAKNSPVFAIFSQNFKVEGWKNRNDKKR